MSAIIESLEATLEWQSNPTGSYSLMWGNRVVMVADQKFRPGAVVSVERRQSGANEYLYLSASQEKPEYRLQALVLHTIGGTKGASNRYYSTNLTAADWSVAVKRLDDPLRSELNWEELVVAILRPGAELQIVEYRPKVRRDAEWRKTGTEVIFGSRQRRDYRFMSENEKKEIEISLARQVLEREAQILAAVDGPPPKSEAYYEAMTTLKLATNAVSGRSEPFPYHYGNTETIERLRKYAGAG